MLAEDLAQPAVRASEQKEKGMSSISVLYKFKNLSSREHFYLCPGVNRNKISGSDVGKSATFAYNQAMEEGLIPLDMAHPAAQMMSRAFDDEPGKTLYGVFMKPAS